MQLVWRLRTFILILKKELSLKEGDEVKLLSNMLDKLLSEKDKKQYKAMHQLEEFIKKQQSEIFFQLLLKESKEFAYYLV